MINIEIICKFIVRAGTILSIRQEDLDSRMPDLQPENAANVVQRTYLALHVTFFGPHPLIS
ncbi:MAG: hypothetical protein ABS46_05580 [Cytophagaceae bacterium SCN 52-12]|mgnify:CR=1 FL=1|nr:MAG: hypothetical protein ABS46_05580 [Cytophagaceae bacterium SCN 52-12]